MVICFSCTYSYWLKEIGPKTFMSWIKPDELILAFRTYSWTFLKRSLTIKLWSKQSDLYISTSGFSLLAFLALLGSVRKHDGPGHFVLGGRRGRVLCCVESCWTLETKHVDVPGSWTAATRRPQTSQRSSTLSL